VKAEEEPEAPSGLPEGGEGGEDTPMGVPADAEDAERELPGFPAGDIDTAG
jgi:hypothetical protein